MGGRIGWAAIAILAACARPSPRPHLVARPHASPAPSAAVVERDPVAELPVIAVAAGGDTTVELQAVDVHLDWLALELADAPMVSPASRAGVAVTGRLSAPSRHAAFQALLDASPVHGLTLQTPDLTGSGRKVDLSLARMPAPELALLLAELLGDDILVTVDDVPVTVVAHQAPADGVLRALADALGATLRHDEGIWILEPPGDASPSRARHHAKLRIELRADDARADAVADLVRAVAKLGDPRCPIRRPISARLRRAPIDIVAAAVLDGASWVGPACGTARWDGSALPASARLVGIARAGVRSAALLSNREDLLLVAPDPALAKVVIGPTSVGIQSKKWSWEGALAAPALPAELPGSRDFIGDWRLAATLRDGAVWHALLVGDAGAVWVSSTEKDRVLSIEPGKVVLPPERPDEPPIVLQLRRAPR